MLSALRDRWRDWWEARLPRQDQIRLNQRNLYILPSKAGWSFATVVMVLLLASINEQINLGYALSFLLGGTGMAALYQTHGNLQGLSVALSGLHSVHAGQVLQLPLQLGNTHRRLGRYGLQIWVDLRASRRPPAPPQGIDLAPGSEGTVYIDIPTTQRGWLTLPRLTIDTRYPLGLFRAWAYWRPQSRVLIWPALDALAPPLPPLAGTAHEVQAPHMTPLRTELPEGLRDYRRGDPMRWIAWRKSSHALQEGGTLVSREPMSSPSPDRWLDFEHSPGLAHLSHEARLSRLASWLLQAEFDAASGPAYGLRLPGLQIPCGHGPAHLRACLDALAMWQAGATGGASA